jgi:hypothetical protein
MVGLAPGQARSGPATRRSPAGSAYRAGSSNRPPWVGSGQSGRPCLRMHLAKLSSFAISARGTAAPVGERARDSAERPHSGPGYSK